VNHFTRLSFYLILTYDLYNITTGKIKIFINRSEKIEFSSAGRLLFFDFIKTFWLTKVIIKTAVTAV